MMINLRQSEVALRLASGCNFHLKSPNNSHSRGENRKKKFVFIVPHILGIMFKMHD